MSALSVLALPAKAEEKVYYCEMTGLTETTIDGAETFQNEKFKMKVSREKVVFGGDGYLNRKTITITSASGLDRWGSWTRFYTARFKAPSLHFAEVTPENVVAFSARCEDF